MLTEAQKAAYVAARGLCCPYCASDDLNPHMDLSADGPDVTQTVTCASCGEEWVDGFTLTGVTTEDDQGTPPQEGPPGHEADVAAFLAAAGTFLATPVRGRRGEPGVPGELDQLELERLCRGLIRLKYGEDSDGTAPIDLSLRDIGQYSPSSYELLPWPEVSQGNPAWPYTAAWLNLRTAVQDLERVSLRLRVEDRIRDHAEAEKAAAAKSKPKAKGGRDAR